MILRELTRSAAPALGEATTFTPIRDMASVGNGVHVDMRFVDDADDPVGYDPDGPGGMSDLTSAIAAGALK